MGNEPVPAGDWPAQIYTILRRWEVSQFAYVPDAGHRALIERSVADSDVHAVLLTTEEEGVALLVGAHLAGARGVLLTQSSGVGNCANLFSLVPNGQFPMLLLVSMRGEFGEGNPWQVPMGRAARPILELFGFQCLRAERAQDVAPVLEAACTMVFKAGQAVAVLLTQRLIGAKPF